MKNLPTYSEYLSEGQGIFSKFMLEWKVFDEGKWKELNTGFGDNLKSIYDYLEKHKITSKYKISGMLNGKWQSIIDINF